jgi:hypothetical protein
MVMGVDGAYICAGCGHAVAEAGVVAPIVAALAAAGLVGYLGWELAKSLRERVTTAAA